MYWSNYALGIYELKSGFYNIEIDEKEEITKEIQNVYFRRLEKNQADMYFVNITDRWSRIPSIAVKEHPVKPLKNTCVFYDLLGPRISVNNKFKYAQIELIGRERISSGDQKECMNFSKPAVF